MNNPVLLALKTIHINNCNLIKLNSYRPLCQTFLGIRAIKKYNFPPFIDGSCRREPDFENPYPSITALCRQWMFAPTLNEDDVVVYMTVGKKYGQYQFGHHLVAILQAKRIFKNHKEAADHYCSKTLPLPSNCMIRSNPPYNFEQTSGNYIRIKDQMKYLNRSNSLRERIGTLKIKEWDSSYMNKAAKWEAFVQTEKIYLNLYDPPLIRRMDFDQIFGHLPNTRSPKKITEKHLVMLGQIAGLDISISH